VVVNGPPTSQVRTEVPKAFKSLYGIDVQYTGGQSADVVLQLQQERQAGIYSRDIILAGANSMYGPIYGGKMLTPLPPILTQPGAADPTQWPQGSLWFMDPEQQYILRLNNYLTPIIAANTDLAPASSITSWNDLLKPELTGKIASFDPTTSGAGVQNATYLYTKLGEDYARKLFVDQKIVVSRDHRQLSEWLARGTYSLALSVRDVELSQVRQDGFPVAYIPSPPEAPSPITAGFGLLGALSNAPHPNAQKLFANWIASKDGMDVWSRAQYIVPIRKDVDKSAYPPENIPDSDVSKYFDQFGWDFIMNGSGSAMEIFQGWLQP
jgi:iron(III) transport system substrate-binding protein